LNITLFKIEKAMEKNTMKQYGKKIQNIKNNMHKNCNVIHVLIWKQKDCIIKREDEEVP
jgi:hypothetical protein